ncbi:RNA pseudouridylate synthase domain-containing protein 1-like [Lytechinus pictus]|uniref:RNA pseudouridylate synthase domain-containing protein 1-like n=1 Tax=Lytechinus pictus TaxID=7653 RepID=UPI0030B9DDC8
MVNSLLNRVQVFLRWKYSYFWRVIIGMNSPAGIEDIKILYKSKNFVVVDKHYDVKINSNDPKDAITVATQLARLHPELVDESLPHSFRFIHRLDYSTSGALCIALNKNAAAIAMKYFKDRRVTKEYLALILKFALLKVQERNRLMEFERCNKTVYACFPMAAATSEVESSILKS